MCFLPNKYQMAAQPYWIYVSAVFRAARTEAKKGNNLFLSFFFFYFSYCQFPFSVHCRSTLRATGCKRRPRCVSAGENHNFLRKNVSQVQIVRLSEEAVALNSSPELLLFVYKWNLSKTKHTPAHTLSFFIKSTSASSFVVNFLR